jgi:selenophosphate synthase
VKVPLSLKKFLMTKVIEKYLMSTIVRETSGITSAVVVEGKGGHYIQTEGVNFNILKDHDFIDTRKVASNDVHWVSEKFGVILMIFRLRRPGTPSLGRL